MKKTSGHQLANGVIMAATICLVALPCHAALVADPSIVIFTRLDQTASIKLMENDLSIPTEDIKGWRFLASGYDYIYMLDVAKENGALKISPGPNLEVGSYDFVITTLRDSVTVKVLAPLNELPDIVEKTASLTGLSEKAVRERMGLTTTLGLENVQINLPPVYYEGQTLELTMRPEPDTDHVYTWFMNGDIIASGPEYSKLLYTFKESGDYVLTYVETKKVSGQTAPVAHAQAFTRVVRVPGVKTEIAPGASVEYASPDGYRVLVWSIDDIKVSTEPTLKHTFNESGTHIVECIASEPDSGFHDGYIRIRYITSVKPSS